MNPTKTDREYELEQLLRAYLREARSVVAEYGTVIDVSLCDDISNLNYETEDALNREEGPPV